MSPCPLLSILKTCPEWQGLPVIIWSAECAQDVVDRAIQVGADRFLHKMVTSPIQLAKAVEVVLNETKDNGGKRGQGHSFG